MKNYNTEARQRVGDGCPKNQQNYYYVTISNMYGKEVRPHEIDFIPKNAKTKTIERFDSYNDALEFAENITIGSIDKVLGANVNYIMIEDRISGTVFEKYVCIWRKQIMSTIESYEDIKFTKKVLGAKFG